MLCVRLMTVGCASRRSFTRFVVPSRTAAAVACHSSAVGIAAGVAARRLQCRATTASTSTASAPLAQTWLRRLLWRLRCALRALRLLCTFSPLIVVYPAMSLTSVTHRLWWTLMLALIELSGPTIIKAAQWASTRRDLLSITTCQRLARLQRRTRARPWRMTEQILRETFGADWPSMFRRFDTEPIGSGCVAQVFRAEIDPIHFAQNDGARNLKMFHKQAYVPVAVKIAHPSIIDEISIDLAVLTYAARLVEFVVPSTRYARPVKCVHEFRDKMETQVDLRHEGRALTRFAHNFSRSDRVRFPIPLLYTRELLVETFEDGIPIAHFLPHAPVAGVNEVVDAETRQLRATLAMTGVRAVCQMVFIDNFVHGDLHPGNILVTNHERRMRPDDMFTCAVQRCRRAMLRMRVLCDTYAGTSYASEFDRDELAMPMHESLNLYEPTIVILDAGITVELSAHDMINFRNTFRGILLSDGAYIADQMLAEPPQPYVIDSAGFRDELRELVDRAVNKEGGSGPIGRILALKHLSVAQLLSDLFTIVAAHHVCVEPNYTCVFLALMVLEGLGRSMDPELDLLSAARPFIWKSV